MTELVGTKVNDVAPPPPNKLIGVPAQTELEGLVRLIIVGEGVELIPTRVVPLPTHPLVFVPVTV